MQRARVSVGGPASCCCAPLLGFAQVPLDVVCSYHERLVRCAAQLPHHRALSWLQQRDEEERQWWCDRHRNSSLPLGKIIREGLEKREIMWLVSTAPSQPPPAPALPARAPQRKHPAAGAPWAAAPAGGGAQSARTADSLKNGQAICRAFNAGGCREPCPRNMLHVCSAITGKGGHVCGMKNHGAHQCKRAVKGAGAALAPK